MALHKLKHDPFAAPVEPLRPALSEAAAHMLAAPSPARALHERLHHSVHAAPEVGKWSQRRSVAVIVTVSAGLWAALIGSGYGIAHILA